MQIFLLTIYQKKTKVLSPTFPIVNIYKIKKNEIWHYDLYRIKDKNEFFTLDFDVALNHCVLVEWPELMEEFFPKKESKLHLKKIELITEMLKFVFWDLTVLIIKKYGNS